MRVCTTCAAEYGDDKLFCERDGTPLRKSAAGSDLVGEVIADRYHITKKLGEGGMGQVYLAEHVKMGRRCAIKIMTPGTMSDPDAISRFNREAANASRISHPNVCAIYDFGETPEGLIYLAMELIDGKSLTALLDETPTMPLARAANMIVQCGEALHVAHELGIVHRDLKPDNIMVITARGKDIIKVVDFGIAKAMSGDEGSKQKVTKTGFVVGTPEYMSPEQLAGDGVDGRSDIYSLGLVFYRMLTGVSPFPADSQQETMIKRLTDDPITLAAARPDVRFPVELQRVIDRALARSPSERYADAADFARDVRKLSTTMTGAVDVEAGTQVVKAEDLKAALPPTRVDPAAAAALRPKEPPRTSVARPEPAKKPAPLVPIAAAVIVLALGGGAYAMRGALFGGAVPDSTVGRDTSKVIPTQTSNPADTGKPPVIPATTRDTTTKPVTPGNVRPTGSNTGPLRDSAGTRPPRTVQDLAALERELNLYYDDLDFVDDDAKRAAGKISGTKMYGLTTAPASVRARGAFVMGQALLKENDREGARLWMGRAVQLDPSQGTWKTILNQLESP